MRDRTCSVWGVLYWDFRDRRRLLPFAKEQLGVYEVEARLLRITAGRR
jgi:hypothetical protein